MGFFDSLKRGFFSAGGDQPGPTHEIYVRCRRCGEVIKARIDLQRNLTPRDEGGYLACKTLVGNQLCFERLEATLFFDEARNLSGQEIKGGDFITAEEYEAARDESKSG